MGLRRHFFAAVACLSVWGVGCNKSALTTTQTPILTLSVASVQARTVAKGGPAVPITVSGKLVGSDGKSTPLTGTVALSIDNDTDGSHGTIEATVVLDPNGQALAHYLPCTSGDACRAPQTTVVKASLPVSGGTPIASSITFSIPADTTSTCMSAASSATLCSDPTCANADCTLAGGAGKCNVVLKTCIPANLTDGTVTMTIDIVDSNGNAPTNLSIPVGSAPYTIKVTVAQVANGMPAADASVHFEIDTDMGKPPVGGFAAEAGSTTTTQTVDIHVDKTSGIATASFVPASVVATGKLVISVAGHVKVSSSRQVDTVVPGTLVFTPAAGDPYFRTMGVRSSGYNEQSLLRFSLLDSSGHPFVGEATVKFTVPPVGGVSLSPAQLKTDANGQVTTTLYSGTQAGTIAVTATTTVGSTTLTTTSETIAIVGAKASSRNFAVACGKDAVNALVGNDCTFMQANTPVSCTAVLGDRFNNALGRSVKVSWVSESALFGPPTSTPAAVADSAGPQMGLGMASNVMQTTGARMPKDVDPIQGEPSRVGSVTSACQSGAKPRVFNPRDGLNTFIAMTQGEEGFVDTNGNGTYDVGEKFYDLGEPFIDANDNNVRDPDEEFIDLNNNGVWDGPNGKWDDNTTIWATGHVVFTGTPTATSILLTPPPPVAFQAPVEADVRWEDENLNEPAPAFTTYASNILSGLGKFQQISPPTYPDHFSSMQVVQAEVCDVSGLQCHLETRISYTPGPQQVAVFTAPSEKDLQAAPAGSTGSTGSTTPASSGFDSRVGFSVSLSDVNATRSTSSDIVGVAPVCDDSSGNADCTLNYCVNKLCNVAGTKGTCALGGTCNTGSLTNSDYQVDLSVTDVNGTASALRVPAGGTPLTVTAHVIRRQDGSSVAGGKVTFDADSTIGTFTDGTPGGQPGTPASTISLITNSVGVATAIFHPGSGAAKGNMTVGFDTIRLQRVIDIVVPGALVFTPAPQDPYFRVMGVRTSGWREQNLLRFTLLDSTGQPYLGNAKVNFTVTPLGGVSIIPTSLNTDGLGQVVTTIYSGVSAGTVAVTATLDGTKLSVQSDTIAIVGAKANGRNLSVRCSEQNLPSLFGNDCTYMHADFTTTCTAVLGDRFNNTVGRDVRVNWSTEAGLFGPPSSTALANPNQEPAAQPDLGRSVNTLRTLNTPMPLDVAPMRGEPSIAAPANDPCQVPGVPTRVLNPRDGLITFIAHTQGEEGFVDSNQNGQYDPGELFYDLGEPYIDANDNNIHDPGEVFIDTNGDGVYNGPNGVWDANTTIWTTGHVVVSGGSLTGTFTINNSPVAVFPFVDHDQLQAFGVGWTDPNLNEPAVTYTTFGLNNLFFNSSANLGGLYFNSVGNFSAPEKAPFLDRPGSMDIYQPTVCDTTGTICQLQTEINFTGPRQLQAIYQAGGASDPLENKIGAEAVSLLGTDPMAS
jgi:hypothetical protein